MAAVTTAVTVAEAITIGADIVEGIARGVAALQQLQGAVVVAQAAGQSDIPFTAVQAARDWMIGQRSALAKDLGIDPGIPTVLVDPNVTATPQAPPVVQVPPHGSDNGSNEGGAA